MIKQLSKNFLMLSLSEGLSHFLGFVVNAYIARILGVSGFGLINYSLAFLTYLLLFSNMGLTTLGTREVVKDKNNIKIIGDIISTRILLIIILYIIFLLFLLLLPGDTLTKKIILLYIITGLPNAFYLEFIFQAREEMEFIGLGRILQYAGYLILIFLFLKTKEQILAVPLSYLGGYLLATLFLVLVYFKKYPRLVFSFKPVNFYNILGVSLPIGFATIVYQAVMNFSVICLKMFHNETEVGLFSAGFKIIIFLLIIERIINYLFFPIFSRQANQSQEMLKKSFIFFSQLVLGITILVAIIGGIFAQNIISLIYGTSFNQGAGTFRILILYFIIAPLNTIWGYGLIALNQEKKFFKVIVVTALTNLILTIILGYIFRGVGVALAIFISELCGLILMKQKLNSVINFSIFTMFNKKEIKLIFTGKN